MLNEEQELEVQTELVLNIREGSREELEVLIKWKPLPEC